MGWSNSGGWSSHGWGRPAVRNSLLSGIIAYWDFDEGTGTSAADTTGNGNTGILTNGATWAAGKINDGISVASNQYVNIGNNAALNFNGTMPFTLALWGNTSVSTNAAIFDALSGTAGYRVGLGEGAGTPAGALAVFMNGVWNRSTSTVLANGAWHHMAVAYDGTNLMFYVDSALDKSVAASGPTSVSMNRSIGNIAGSSFPFGGVLDEFGIWSRALSASEIAALYNGGAGQQYPF